MSAIIAATARAYGQARAPTQPRGKDLALLRWTRITTDRHPTQLAHALAGPDHHLMAHGRPSHSHTHTVPDAPVPASCADGAPRGQPYRPVQLDPFDAVIAAPRPGHRHGGRQRRQLVHDGIQIGIILAQSSRDGLGRRDAKLLVKIG